MLEKKIISAIESRIGIYQYQILEFIKNDNNNFEVIILLNKNGYIIKKILYIQIISNNQQLKITENSVPNITSIEPSEMTIGQNYRMLLFGSNLENLKGINFKNVEDDTIMEAGIFHIGGNKDYFLVLPQTESLVPGTFEISSIYNKDEKMNVSSNIRLIINKE